MRRRRLLRVLAAGLASGTAGCLGRQSAQQAGTRTPAETPTPSPTPTPTPAGDTATPGSNATTVDGVELPVPLSEMRQPLPRGYIPAVVDPAFSRDWSGLDAGSRDPTLPDDAPVLGVERDGRARASSGARTS